MEGVSASGDGPSGAESRYQSGRLELSKLSLAGGMAPRETIGRLSEIAAAVLEVNRVSVWRFEEGRQAIRCEHLLQAVPPGKWEGALLHRADFPEYFRALESHRVAPVADVDGDPLTAEFREPYFRPLGISSMLDAPIYRAGAVIGVVCHEQVGRIRRWSSLDREFAAAVADAFGRLYEESDRIAAEATLGSLRTRLQALERMSALGRLAAGIAHDFRNVLAVAAGHADLIATSTADPRLGGLVGELRAALDVGLRLAGDLTEFGRVGPVKPRVVDLAEQLDRYRRMLAMAAGPTVTLAFDVAAPVSRVFIDEAQLGRILVNLVLNARDAMPSGGTVTIALRGVQRGPGGSPDADFALLEVRDTGVGMDAATRERIFEPFFTTKGEKGTGLGLAVVSQGVAHAGGFLEVDSEPGRGTRVRILLPGIATAAAGR